MARARIVLLLTMLVSMTGTTSLHAGPWKRFRGHKYRLTPTPCDWHEAERQARKLGGHLVAIDDRKEQEWLVKTFGGHTHLWIGCTDEKKEGRWRWTTGAKLKYANWGPGEPNNQNDEDYSIMNFRGPGLWNDLGPNSSEWGAIHGIVEVGAPEESTAVPPGFVLVETRHGDACVGTLEELEMLRLSTRYGVLTIPKDDLVAVDFTANATERTPRERSQNGRRREPATTTTARVLTARFEALGRVELEEFRLTSRYGTLRFLRSDVLRVRFGRSKSKVEVPGATRRSAVGLGEHHRPSP